MAILRGSRYEGVPFTGIKTTDGKTKKLLHDRRVFTREDIGQDFIEHTIEGEEELDALADRYYKNDELWWLIADVNNKFFMFDVTVGETIVVPSPSVLADLGIDT